MIIHLFASALFLNIAFLECFFLTTLFKIACIPSPKHSVLGLCFIFLRKTYHHLTYYVFYMVLLIFSPYWKLHESRNVCLFEPCSILTVRQCARIFAISCFFFFFLLLHWTACGIVVPQRGIQPTPFTVRAQSLTTGPPEFPKGLCYP